MKNILTALYSVILLLSSCATKPVKMVSAPRAERLDALKKSVASSTEVPDIRDESESLAKAYLQALKSEGEGNAKLACNLFEDLSTQKALPIRDAALIHSLNDCSYSASELKSLWAEAQVANYLKEPYFEISKKLALQKDLSAYEAEFSYALIPFKPIQSEKVQLIKRAIEIATKNSDAEKLKYYTEKLKEISPQFNTDINEVNMYKVARDFESSRKFSKARELYKRIVNEKDFSLEEKIKAYNAYRTTYKIERDLKTFLAKTYEMETFLKGEIDFHPGDKKYAEAWVDSKIALARAVWTNHQNSEAQKILDELSKTHLGNSNQLATVQYLFGSLHLENKENIEALKRFEKAIAGTITDSALAENIQWAVVWNNYLLKNDNKAILHIENFTKKSINQAFLAKLNFWKGKSLLRLGKSEEAETTFSSVADADPFGYYGILSSIELKKPFNPLPPAAINTDPTGKFYLDWLIALDEKLFAQKALKEIDSQFKTPEEREKAMSLYYQTEWFQGGMRQIYNFKMSARNSITEKYHSVVFPTPYQLIIDTLAQKYGVPKELIYSITRQESAFVPSERSWADAFGLMQMIPEKAHELSKKYKIPYRDYNDLYKPEINLEMGTALLKDLRSKFNSKFAQTVAAYNASNEVIRIWERERFNGNYVEFIESIPYEETRNYIKLVFRNYITYKRITSKDSFIINKDFFATPF